MIYKIAILGDFNPTYPTLNALNDSTRHVQKYLDEEIHFDWIPTDIFNPKTVFEEQNYKGLWIAPGSPYRSMENVINTIQYSRINNVPTFGNCGGFQHMVLEFAKNVCGIDNADHEETNPEGSNLLIKKLACSLKAEQENLKIIDKTSSLYKVLTQEQLLGKYNCSYGINEEYVPLLEENGMTFTSISEDGNYRSFEIKSHPFFIGTLFQPALTSSEVQPNRIIIEFVKNSIANS